MATAFLSACEDAGIPKRFAEMAAESVRIEPVEADGHFAFAVNPDSVDRALNVLREGKIDEETLETVRQKSLDLDTGAMKIEDDMTCRFAIASLQLIQGEKRITDLMFAILDTKVGECYPNIYPCVEYLLECAKNHDYRTLLISGIVSYLLDKYE